MLTIAQFLKEKWLKITGFAHSQTKNKLVNEAANDSARVSGQDRKKPPTLGNNQIAGFGGFRPLTSLKKIKIYYYKHSMQEGKTFLYSLKRVTIHNLQDRITILF